MSQFLGTHQNRLDSKGRVSIPAAFRAALKALGDGNAAVVLRPSHKHDCIEAWPEPAFQSLARPVESMDLFSDDGDDLSLAVYADAYPIEADKEGRIVLPATLVAHAGLTDSVTFMGAGRHFQIWEPAAAAARVAQARQRARTLAVPTRPGSAASAPTAAE